jgi:hypothetical protein
MEERDQNLIDRYIAGEATAAERMEVDQRRQADPVFRQALEEYEIAQQSLRLRQREELRERFRHRDLVLDKKKPELTNAGRRRILWLWVAVALLVGFLIWRFVFSHTTSAPSLQTEGRDSLHIMDTPPVDTTTVPQQEVTEDPPPADKQKKDQQKHSNEDRKRGEELFAENFEPYKDLRMDPSTRSGDEPTMQDRFARQYWEGRFQHAVDTFKLLEAKDQQNDN